MTEKKLAKNNNIVLSIMMLLGSIIILLFLAYTGNSNEKFTDVVIENLAIIGGNKSSERVLVYGLILVGIVAYLFYDLAIRKKRLINTKEELFDKVNTSAITFIGFLTLYIVQAAVYNTNNWLLLISLFLYIVSKSLKKTSKTNIFVVYFCAAYALLGIYRLLTLFLGTVGVTQTIYFGVIFVAFLISLVILLVDNPLISSRFILLCQIFIPLNISVLLYDRYEYHEQIIQVSNPIQAVAFISIILLVLIALSIKKVLKDWNGISDIDNAITTGAFIAIMFVNRFNGTGAMITTDVHHPYENIIGYFQVFEQGQSLFKQYVPISGLYSLLHGFLFKIFGNGEASFYYISDNIYYLVAIIATALLLKNRIENIYILFISLTFMMIDYDRVIFIFPIMLILSHPSLIKRRGWWGIVWFITSLFHGLYYPLYGAAVALAFLPLGIKQVKEYVGNKEYKADFKSIYFVGSCILSLMILILSVPALYGMYKHISMLSSQTILADGLARFGQTVPQNLFPVLARYQGIRVILYYLLSFLPLVLIAWVGFILFVLTKNCIYLAVALVPAVSYSSTLVRIDFDSIYARSEAPVFAACFMVIILILNEKVSGSLKKYMIILSLTIVAISGQVGLSSVGDKLDSIYRVPDNYIYVENDPVERLGHGFVEDEMYYTVSAYHEKFKDKEDLTFLGDPIYFGHFYLGDVNGIGPIEIVNIPKSYDAATEALECVRNNYSFVGSVFYPHDTYYIYNWLMTSGEYIWSAENAEFVPNVYDLPKEEVLAINKTATVSWEDYELGRVPGTLGDSMDALRSVFTPNNVDFDVQGSEKGINIALSEAINGDDADFLYIAFGNAINDYQYGLFGHDGFEPQENPGIFKSFYRKEANKEIYVQVIWYDDNETEHVIYCSFVNGKLLIPLGAGSNWLLNKHSDIYINIFGKAGDDFDPYIEEIELLKLRELF